MSCGSVYWDLLPSLLMIATLLTRFLKFRTISGLFENFKIFRFLYGDRGGGMCLHF